jgi:hypothetical protein
MFNDISDKYFTGLSLEREVDQLRVGFILKVLHQIIEITGNLSNFFYGKYLKIRNLGIY